MGGQSLWSEFIGEKNKNVADIILSIGVDGLMEEFENWLHDIGVLNYKKVKEYRDNKIKNREDNNE